MMQWMDNTTMPLFSQSGIIVLWLDSVESLVAGKFSPTESCGEKLAQHFLKGIETVCDS